MDVLAEIIKHGLSVRQIPLEVVSIFDPRHGLRGGELIQWNGRDMVKTVRVPEHAGWWMCKKVEHTLSVVNWDMDSHNLKPTLEESVALYLEKQKEEGK